MHLYCFRFLQLTGNSGRVNAEKYTEETSATVR